jgi:hypothetical protein
MRKSIRILIENNRWRRTPKRACGARVLVRSQAVDGVAAVVIDGPATDAVAEVFLVTDAVVEARADGCGERSEEEGGEGREVHFGWLEVKGRW